MATATDKLPMLTRHFSQFQRKELPYKVKVLIEGEVNPEEILERMLVRVIFKELQAVAFKLWTALKKVLTSKGEKESLEGNAQKRDAIQLALI